MQYPDSFFGVAVIDQERDIGPCRALAYHLYLNPIIP
jgi:hypothetical protein